MIKAIHKLHKLELGRGKHGDDIILLALNW